MVQVQTRTQSEAGPDDSTAITKLKVLEKVRKNKQEIGAYDVTQLAKTKGNTQP